MTSRNTQSMVLLVRAKNLASRELRSVGRDLQQVQTRSGKFKNAARTMGKVGAGALVGIGAAAGALAIGGVRAFGNFEDKMNESLAIMGNVAPELRDEMSDTAREIAKTTRIGAEQAAESYFFLASAGLDAEQSIAALPQVAAFAQAGMFDMARATDLATDAQSALGLTVPDATKNLENMTRVTDVLVKANTLANASVEQFSTALTNKAGAALKIVNKDIEEGVAVLAAFADQGIKGERAGNALNIVFRDLQTKAIKNKEAFEDNNVAVFDSTGKMNNMADIVGDLEGLLEGMTDEQKKATLSQMGFADRSLIYLQTLLGTSDAMRGYEEDLRSAGGATDEVADNQLESINAQFDLLKNRAHDAMIGLGEDLGPTIKEELLPALNNLVDSTAMFMETIGPPLITAVSGVVSSLQGMQVIALDIIGIWDEDAKKKKEMIVLNRELANGLGENLAPHRRLSTAIVTLGQNNAWTEENIRGLISTVGGSPQQIRAARDEVREYAEAHEYGAEFIEMLDNATRDAIDSTGQIPRTTHPAAQAMGAATEAAEGQADAMEEITEETEEAIDAQAEYTDQLKALTDPVFGAVDALGNLEEAEARVVELEEDGKEGTQEWREAMLDMAEATIGAQDSLDDISAEQLEETIGAIGTAMGTSREETIDFLEELGVLDGKKVSAIVEVQAPEVQYTGHPSGRVTPRKTQTYNFRQQGGPFYRGDQMIVGEDGIEFMTAARSGSVVSNPATPGGNFEDFVNNSGPGTEELINALRSMMEDNPRVVFAGDMMPRTTASADDIANAIDYKVRQALSPR